MCFRFPGLSLGPSIWIVGGANCITGTTNGVFGTSSSRQIGSVIEAQPWNAILSALNRIAVVFDFFSEWTGVTVSVKRMFRSRLLLFVLPPGGLILSSSRGFR